MNITSEYVYDLLMPVHGDSVRSRKAVAAHGPHGHDKERRGVPWWVAITVIKPILVVVRRRDWRGTELLPGSGGVILAANHVSHVDPLLLSEMVLAQRRVPAFLAKSALFDRRLVGWWFRSAGHIAVDREEGRQGYDAALAAVRSGRVVLVYPEGSITKADDGWPMAMKNGAARLALESGAPLLPVAQWGAQELLPAYSKRPHPLRRPRVLIEIGPPVDLDDLRGGGSVHEAASEGTRRLFEAIVGMLERVRGEGPPVRLRPAEPSEPSPPEV
ncbi:lysophospholipid acyltransferase family protein [Nocardioides stalactiti]|uniref:lysophospholipid acyltransferase family protein n=1 Tax=Nocardioides stalactiti TaxID=2755356 RepID=UPI0028A7DB0D|nr:lysophospholipid acyltransferase family protein [Nocardioides stalactiti]